MPLADDLGNLILNLNPYTKNTDNPKKQTGAMDIYVGNGNPSTNPNTPPSGSLANIELEVDTNYPADWEFKEEKQHINTAIRIKYRYLVYDASNNPLYWIEDYLLIGFEGSGGP